MAATVGATLSGVTFALRHAGEGPFISSGGNVYFFGRDSVNTGTVEPHKATDPTSAFTAQTAKTMSSATTTAIEAMACYQVGQVIHVVSQISTGQVFYNFYTMDTDTWGLTTSETAAAAASFAPTANSTFVSLVVRSGGEVVILYCGGVTVMSGTFNQVKGTRRTGTNTYSAFAANVDSGGSINWLGCVAALGASDRVHCFFVDRTNTRTYHRALSSANVLQTISADQGIQNASMPFGNAISYNDGGTTRVRASWGGSSGLINVMKFDSADVPTISLDTAILTDGVDNLSGQSKHHLVNDGTILHEAFIDTAGDIKHGSSAAGGGAWGAQVLELAAAINRISTSIYTRSGAKYLAMVLDDAAVIKYAEIMLAAAYAPKRRLVSQAALVRSNRY